MFLVFIKYLFSSMFVLEKVESLKGTSKVFQQKKEHAYMHLYVNFIKLNMEIHFFSIVLSDNLVTSPDF